MRYSLVTTRRFDRELADFRRAHPDLGPRLAKLLRDLECDPFQAHLGLHVLRGELAGLYAARLTRSYRLILRLDSARQELVLIDIGAHDDVYR